MSDVVDRIEGATSRKAYGRGDHLPAQKATGGMLTPERLSEVSWALGKMQDAERAVDRLLEGEPTGQPPSERRVEMTKIVQDLDHLSERLEGLFS